MHHLPIVRAFALLLTLIMPGLTSGAARAETCGSIVDLKRTAEKTGRLTHMAAATKLAGLDDPEIDIGPLTLFAPTDEAFEALPEGFRQRLLAPENRQHLVALLMHHAVVGEYPLERLRKARAPDFTIPTVDADGMLISRRHGLSVEGARVVEANILATDGMLHLIDKVLIPPSVRAALWHDGKFAEQPRKLAASDEH